MVLGRTAVSVHRGPFPSPEVAFPFSNKTSEFCLFLKMLSTYI